MIEKLLRWLRGYVIFEIIGNFPERFINLCMSRGRLLFRISSGKEGFFAALLLGDYKEIRPIARRSRVRLRVTERHGLPFLLSRYKMRMGLLVGMALFLVITQLAGSFVWTVELRGVETISESQLMQKLLEEGLYEGAYKNSINTSELERDVMQEFDEIGWMSLNIIGTKAEVEIKEKAKKPDIIDYKTPCNIKASADGLIEKFITKQGLAMFSVGSAVVEGQLLVSGAMPNALDEIDYVHAQAEVIASTTRNVLFEIQKLSEYKMPLETICRHNLIFGWITVPLTFHTVGGDYTSNFVTKKLLINDTIVEFGLKTEHIIPYENIERLVNNAQSKKILRTDDALFRLFALSECQEISANLTYSETDTSFCLDVVYVCTEDIAKEEILVVN